MLGRVSWVRDAERFSLSLSRSRKRRPDRGPSRSRGAAARRAHPAGLARRGGRRARAPLPTGRAEGGHAHGRGRQFPLAPGALHAIRGSPRRGPCPLRPLCHRATPEPRRPGARGGSAGAPACDPIHRFRFSLDPDETALVESALAPVADRGLASTVRRLVSKDLVARRARSLAILVLTGGALAATLAGCATAGGGETESTPPAIIAVTPAARRPDRGPGRSLRPLRDRPDGGAGRPPAPSHRAAEGSDQDRSRQRDPLDPALPVAGRASTTCRARSPPPRRRSRSSRATRAPT